MRDRDRSALLAVLGLSLGALVIEALGGLYAGSLALLVDAGHAAMDVAAIGLTLVAVELAARPPSLRWTFGYLRVEILAALVDAVLLVGIGAFIIVEGLRRLAGPTPILPGPMFAVALAGLAVNAASAALLGGTHHDRPHLHAAYLDVLGDLGGSVAALLGAVIIALTGWTPADVLASLVIGLLIVARTAEMLRDAVEVLLEATPRGVDLATVRRHVLEAPGVVDCHDLHAWTITSGLNVVSAHVVLARGAEPSVALAALSDCLAEDFDIEHSTFQLESIDRRRLEQHSHA